MKMLSTSLLLALALFTSPMLLAEIELSLKNKK